MQSILDQLLKFILGKLLSEQSIRDLVARLESIVQTAVASLFAMLLAWLLSQLNDQPDDLVLGLVQSEHAVQTVGSASVLIILVQLAIKLLPFVLGFRGGVKGVMVLSLLAGSSAYATEIDGPSSVSAGRLAVYTARVEDGSGVAWLVFPEDVADYREVDKTLILTGPPGRYSIHLLEFRASAQPPLTKVRKTLDIGAGPGPTPPPDPDNPNPPPTPPPDLPAGRFGLAKFAYSACAQMVPTDRAKAASIGSQLAGLGAALAAGGIRDPNELLTQTRDALNAHGPAWQTFRTQLSAELSRQNFAKRPKLDFADAWGEIGTGLGAVR